MDMDSSMVIAGRRGGVRGLNGTRKNIIKVIYF